jgi:hypothetical protein
MYTAARPESSAVKKTTPGFMGHHHHKYLGLFFFFFLNLYISAVIGHSQVEDDVKSLFFYSPPFLSLVDFIGVLNKCRAIQKVH